MKQGKKSMQKVATVEDQNLMDGLATGSITPEQVVVNRDELLQDLGDVHNEVVNPIEETTQDINVEEAIEKTAEQLTSSTTPVMMTTAPKKKEKVKSISFKVDLGEEDKVSAVFEADVKKMTDERKKEVIKEMGTEVKNMLVMRQHVIDSFDDKKKGKITNSNVYMIKVLYEVADMQETFEVEGTATIASFRDEVAKHFGILKSHWRHWTLVHKGNIDLCESSRKSVAGIMVKVDWKHDDVVVFIKYD